MAKIKTTMRFDEEVFNYFTKLGIKNKRKFNNMVEFLLKRHMEEGDLIKTMTAKSRKEYDETVRGYGVRNKLDELFLFNDEKL